MTHGLGGSSLLFYDLTQFLRLYGEVILFDLRGAGLSDKVAV
jgi:pimeloyl-ACP methyl ester carboxylesterase